jgi:hypothetical protein
MQNKHRQTGNILTHKGDFDVNTRKPIDTLLVHIGKQMLIPFKDVLKTKIKT